MQVPQQVLTVWKENFDKGDAEALAKELEVSAQTVSKALKGEASHENIIRITDYFLRKQKNLINQLKK